jgi:hypothetical protein
MRRIDKKINMVKANILAESRYMESKGLLKEDEYLGGNNLDDLLITLTPEDKNSLKNLVWAWFKWDPSKKYGFQEKDGNFSLTSNGKNAISYQSTLGIGSDSYKINGASLDAIRAYLIKNM